MSDEPPNFEGLPWAEKARRITAVRFDDLLTELELDPSSPTRAKAELVAQDLGISTTAVRAELEERMRTKPKDGLRLLGSKELWKMQHQPTRFVVSGILPEGVTLLGGRPKVGKSWLALDIAIGVSDGGLALGSALCTAGDVLCLVLEDNLRRMTKRLRILCPDRPPTRIDFAMECPRLGQGGEKLMRGWLDNHPEARAIIIDTLARIRPAANNKESLYQNDYAVGQFLIGLCRERQIAILLIHHTRKMESDEPVDKISGTLGLAGSVDGFLILERDPAGDSGTLIVNGRDIEEPGEFALAWDKHRARWSLTDGDPRIQKLIPEQRRVVSALNEAPQTVREITEALHPAHVIDDPAKDIKYASVARSLRRLRDRGLVFRDGYKWAIKPHTGITVSVVSPTPPTAHTDTTDTTDSTDTNHTTNEATVREYLHTVETDPELIAEVVKECQRNPNTMRYWLARAEGKAT